MFQQFKNIFPNASLNIRSITESVGLNDSEWNRGIERLEALKSEFQNLNSIFLNRQDSNETVTPIETTEKESCSITELKATGKVIEKLQEGWDTIHTNNQANFEKAKTADAVLRQLQTTGEIHYTVCEQMESSPDIIKDMQTNLKEIEGSAAQLMNVLANLEQQIDEISVDYERQQFELWKETQELELMEEMKLKRQLLREKETRLKLQFEEYDTIQKQKKVELYEANFNAELEDYKRRRETEVSSLYSHHSNTDEIISTTLEQLQLDVDKGKGDLDQFLGDPSEIPKKKKKEKKKKLSKSKLPKHVSASSDEEGRVEILQDEDYQDF